VCCLLLQWVYQKDTRGKEGRAELESSGGFPVFSGGCPTCSALEYETTWNQRLLSTNQKVLPYLWQNNEQT
jgi:hypothetical protein